MITTSEDDAVASAVRTAPEDESEDGEDAGDSDTGANDTPESTE